MQTIWRLRVAYSISKPTRAQEHARVRAPTHPHTHTHTRTDARTHTHALTHASANTRTEVMFIAFHGNNGFENAPECYVTHKLPVLLLSNSVF